MNGLLNSLVKPLHDVGALFLFYKEIFVTFLQTSGNRKPIAEQIASVTFRSFATVVFSGFFVGAILVLQFNTMLSQYDAQKMLGGLNTSACVREVGPLIISFLLAGKIGAYTAAELGTMRVTEQIDAIRCLGTHPIQYLVLPRFVAIVISSLVLLLIGLLVSVMGAMLVAVLLCDVNFLQFAASIPQFVGLDTVLAGMFKSLVYGFIVAGVACHRGYTASGGAKGVGRAVTESAVYTNLYIVIANHLSSRFLHFVEDAWRMLP